MAAILTICALFAAMGALLGWADRRFATPGDPVTDAIDAVLPQIQCGQCRYPGCRPYAEAISKGEADINQCPPGGNEVIRRLAELLGTDPRPLADGLSAPASPQVARIDEVRCIGCTLCIQACPVDAILGAQRLAHTVITAECTGCELCLPPCPVDCISLDPL